MTQQGELTKAKLLEELRSSRQHLLDRLGALPEDRFEQGRYEGGWNARQILAHVASIEWTYPKLIDIARQGPREGAGQKKSGGLSTGTMRGGIDDYNER